VITSLDRDTVRQRSLLPLPGRRLKPLWLNRAEALQLLELSVTSTAALAQDEHGALLKLGEVCRAFLRDDGTAS
jgi:hypothetical protein